MSHLLLVVTALAAVIDWLAVWRGWRRTGFIAKPLTIVLLFAWLASQTGLRGQALWFGIGLLFSLVGDVCLMLPPRFFMAGLTSFALVHLAYLIGFIPFFPVNGGFVPWGLVIVIGIYAFTVIRRVTSAQTNQGLKKMVGATYFYAILINLMLAAAIWTQYRPDWSINSALLVTMGAALFYISDVTNALIRFVNPMRGGRVLVMVTYHIGQVLLISGVVLNLSLYSSA
jgi:uncharacterized membrane protein YhhN